MSSQSTTHPATDGSEGTLAAFCAQLSADQRSSATISAYARDLRLFATVAARIAPQSAIISLGHDVITNVLSSQEIQMAKGKSRSAASLHRLKAAVRSFYNWATDTGQINDNPARKIKMHKLHRKPPIFLTFTEKKTLLKELKSRQGFQDLRDRVMIEILLGTGIRLAELAGLNVDDIDIVAKHLRVKAKGNVCQVKFLKTDLRVLLRRYLSERQRHGAAHCEALFLSNRDSRLTDRQIANRVEHWLAKAGIEKHLTPHGLRHTFATHLYDATSDLLIVQRALGHRAISSTTIYTHLVDGKLEEALERL